MHIVLFSKNSVNSYVLMMNVKLIIVSLANIVHFYLMWRVPIKVVQISLAGTSVTDFGKVWSLKE